jgi:6-phosphogluconate dehydrogenase
MASNKADIAIIGLAVMGENLALNMESKGFTVAVYNRTTSKVDNFVNGRGKGKKFIACRDIAHLADNLQSPRRIMMMVQAGKPVDDLIEQLLPHLTKGDILIDGGNSLYTDTTRRVKYLESKGFLFVGCGVSGGEEGALNGPSLMPGGSSAAWPHVKHIFQSIAAKVEDGSPCCDWVGPEGAGHFVKMVHNGIEYGDMQLICETYQMMKTLLGMTNEELHKEFSEWNKGDLDSYLIEITSQIFAVKDPNTKEYVVDKILDVAGQKGTGKWTVQTALDFGMPLTMIAEAVFARCLSALKDQRVRASQTLKGPSSSFSGDRKAFTNSLAQALYASKIVSYTQGYMVMAGTEKEYGWKLNYGGIALMWRGGCIIRSKFLGEIKKAFERNPNLENLLLDPFFTDKVHAAQKGWREVCAAGVLHGIPMPGITSALAFYDGYRSKTLPANLLQAQRDFFGAHMFERIDKPRGEFEHFNWTGHGGTTASSAYNR